MFKIVGFVHLEGRATSANPLPSCEHCGHEIRNIFTIEDEQGRQSRVGSDCVLHLVAQTDTYTEASKIIKRMERAASQWRKQQPAPLKDETRQEYINRRVTEMGNALEACKAWHAEYAQKFQPKGTIGGWSTTYDMRVESKAELLGTSINRTSVILRHMERIAKQFKANPSDFRKGIWDVKKI